MKSDGPCESNPDDGVFRIGEEVECRGAGGLWYSGKVGVVIDKTQVAVAENTQVRRKSAWKPKDGEAVLWNCQGIAMRGTWDGFKVVLDDGTSVMRPCPLKYKNRIDHGFTLDSLSPWMDMKDLKPFDACKIGKPWSEI